VALIFRWRIAKIQLGGKPLFTWPNRCTHSIRSPLGLKSLNGKRKNTGMAWMCHFPSGSQRVLNGPNTTIYWAQIRPENRTTSHLKFWVYQQYRCKQKCGGEGLRLKQTDGTSIPALTSYIIWTQAAVVKKGQLNCTARVGISVNASKSDWIKNGKLGRIPYKHRKKRLTAY